MIGFNLIVINLITNFFVLMSHQGMESPIPETGLYCQ